METIDVGEKLLIVHCKMKGWKSVLGSYIRQHDGTNLTRCCRIKVVSFTAKHGKTRCISEMTKQIEDIHNHILHILVKDRWVSTVAVSEKLNP